MSAKLCVDQVKIVEVGLRDGLQNEQVILKTSKKTKHYR
jgi:isopropylmalate/homocitrate/citramalate synthase